MKHYTAFCDQFCLQLRVSIVHQELLLRPWNKANQIHLVSHCLFSSALQKCVQFIILTQCKLHCFIVLVTWLMKDTWYHLQNKSDCFLVLWTSSEELGREACKCFPWRYCIELKLFQHLTLQDTWYSTSSCSAEMFLLAPNEQSKSALKWHRIGCILCKKKSMGRKMDRTQHHSSS